MAEEIKSASPETGGASSNQGGKDQDVEANKVVAALSYLWILFLIPLLVKRDSKFTQFHAKQGLVLFIVEIIVSFVNIVPILGQLVWFLASIAFLVISIMGIIKTLNGEWWEMPYIYQWSKKINL